MKLDADVIQTLKSVRVDGNQTTMPQLGRALYVKVNKALECLGGKWNKSAKAHVWEGDPGDPIADAVLTGEVRDWRKELQFFPTPDELADWMVTQADIQPTSIVLEPSVGDGALVRAIRRAHAFLPHIVALDLNMKLVDGVKLDNQCQAVYCADFLSINGELGEFDRILMNPPFSNGQDMAHIRHAYTKLKPGGILVAIASPGWTFRTNRKHVEFREWLNAIDAVWEEVPAGTFSASGTDIRTISIVAQK